MNRKAFYNDNDRFCCDWLSNLMDDGLITPGDIDDGSIENIDPERLAEYERVHLFAGIAGWELALQLAGWTGPVWTGSCPCQPLSGAGKRKGHADSRHLWPAFHDLIAVCKPPVIFGEQVAGPLGREWLAGVRLDLEDLGYACGAADLPAAGVGAPHIRQRLWWVAESQSEQYDRRGNEGRGGREPANGSEHGGVADADGGHPGAEGLQRGGEHGQQQENGDAGRMGISNGPGSQPGRQAAAPMGYRCPAESAGDIRGVGNTDGTTGERRAGGVSGQEASERGQGQQDGHIADGPTDAGQGLGFWAGAEWLECSDGKARRAEPGIFPLADGVSNRVGTLRGAGNAICPELAAEFVNAYRDI